MKIGEGFMENKLKKHMSILERKKMTEIDFEFLIIFQCFIK